MGMFITMLDAAFREVYILETYKSLLWTERYWESGDFDITCTPDMDFLLALSQTKYLDLGGIYRPDKQFMEIETISVRTDPKQGDEVVIKGHTLDRKLNRRVILFETILSGTVETGVDILIQNAIELDPDRSLSNFIYVFGEIPGGLNTGFFGEYVDDAIKKICKSKGLGFFVTYNEQTGNLEFRLREGTDHSREQSYNRIIEYTTALNNLLNAKWTRSLIPYKNVCYVVGENGQVVIVGDAAGEERREIFYKPGISQGELMESEYTALLIQKGLEELSKWTVLETFDGEIDPDSYIFGVDYNMGDVLSLADDYGHTGRARIIEMIYFQDQGGFKVYPTFETVTTAPGGPGGE